MQAGLPGLNLNWALFLDFDGTLAEIAPTPDHVVVDDKIGKSLAQLSEALDGAVAIVSGRPINEIDRYFSEITLPAAGLHGLERRCLAGAPIIAEDDAKALPEARKKMQNFAQSHPGVILEDKKLTLALHYRSAPNQSKACQSLATAIAAGSDGTLATLSGKMVVEVKPAGIDKGTAIDRFMQRPNFVGRLPLFAGDDITDEAGFVAVNRLGGASIKIGPKSDSAARYRINTVREFVNWLAEVANDLLQMKHGGYVASSELR